MARFPCLSRFELFARQQQGDGAIVAAAGVAVSIHRQGATVRLPEGDSLNVVSGGANVPVYHTGDVVAGDQLWVDGDATKLIIVAAGGVFGEMYNPREEGFNARIIGSANPGVTVVDGQRLIVGVPTSTLYKGAEGTGVVSSIVTDTYGRLSGYVREYRYDCIVNTTPTRTLYIDAIGSYVMRTG